MTWRGKQYGSTSYPWDYDPGEDGPDEPGPEERDEMSDHAADVWERRHFGDI